MDETEKMEKKEETQETSQSQYEKQENAKALQKESTTSLEYSPI